MNDDDKTRIIRRSSKGEQDRTPMGNPPHPHFPNHPGEDTTQIVGSNQSNSGETIRMPVDTGVQEIPLHGPGASISSMPTHIMEGKGRPVPNDATVLMRPGSIRPKQDAEGTSSPSPQDSNQSTFNTKEIGEVVGWLAVIEGPGKGKSMEIGNGQNSLGRDDNNRIQLDFGDPGISRMKHLSIVYDSRNKNFFLVTGESSNLSYVDDSPVLAPTLITPYCRIRVSDQTTLLFVPLCGEQFSW